jgi:hypothetical protein
MVKTRQALWTFLICSIFAVTAAFAQSTLTQIQDTVTNADGSPFSGTVVITWNGSTGSSSGATPLSTSAHVYNGALSVLLVPTTTASSLSFYQVVYYSISGVLMWSETWQVPPSATSLTLSAVRTSSTGTSGGGTDSGTGTTGGSTPPGGGQYATLPISISQITSLSADLASINAAVAVLQTQVANALGSSVQVNASFVDGDALSGTLNGSNAVFTISQVPIAGSLAVYRNGLLQTAGVDYTLSGSTITFMPNSVPRSTDTVSGYYRVAGSATTVTFVDSEVPSGTIDGNNLSFTLTSAPNPAASLKLYKNGILLNQGGDYTISGSNVIFANTGVTPKPGDTLIAAYRH